MRGGPNTEKERRDIEGVGGGGGGCEEKRERVRERERKSSGLATRQGVAGIGHMPM